MSATDLRPKLTREQAAVIGAFTGVLCGPFEDIQRFAEGWLGRPIYTHEFALDEIAERVREAARPRFEAMCATRDQEEPA